MSAMLMQLEEYYAMMSSFLSRLGYYPQEETMQFINANFTGDLFTKYMTFYYSDLKEMAIETLNKSNEIRKSISDDIQNKDVLCALDDHLDLLRMYAM